MIRPGFGIFSRKGKIVGKFLQSLEMKSDTYRRGDNPDNQYQGFFSIPGKGGNGIQPVVWQPPVDPLVDGSR